MSRWLALILIFGAFFTGCSREEPPPLTPPLAGTAQPLKPMPPPVPAVPVVSAGEPQSAPVVPGKALQPANSASSQVLLAAPLPLQRVELPAEALAYWRPHAGQRPALLILSGNPMLAPVPPSLRDQVQTLLLQGTAGDLARRGSLQVPDPLLAPIMTVDAALRAGWFSQVVWSLPLRDSARELPADAFRQLLRTNRMLDDQELMRLKIEKHLVRGTVRGTPLLAATLDQIPPLSGPVVVHIDQSYFQDRYKNEVSTPLLSVVYDTLYQLRERRLPVLAVTFAYGNLEERIALDVRFLGEIMAHYIEHPERSKEPAPLNWQRQADIFHLESLFEKEKMRDLALAMERDDPESAWVKFALYRAAAAKKAGDYALDYLAEAARRDRIYAVEYLNLAQMAYDRKRPDAALQMLQLAAQVFPDNPHIRLKEAQLSDEMGDRKTALHLVEQLRKLPWSPVYYPQMPDYLNGFAEYLQKEPPPRAAAPQPAQVAPAMPPAEHNGSALPAGHPGVMPPGYP